MAKNPKPWLNYKSNVPVREYPPIQKKKRSISTALYWLLSAGYLGAHMLYLWNPKEAGKVLLKYLGLLIFLLFFIEKLFWFTEETVFMISNVVAYLAIVIFEGSKLRGNVNAANEKHLLR